MIPSKTKTVELQTSSRNRTVIPSGAYITVRTSQAEEYHGAYTFTPSSQVQTIETEGLVLTDNITINPIPTNYGRITWDGATLTVS